MLSSSIRAVKGLSVNHYRSLSSVSRSHRPTQVQLPKNQVLVISDSNVGRRFDVVNSLCRRIDAEIVVVDLLQIYKHLNVGTHKPKSIINGIPVHCIDVYEPNESFVGKDHVQLIADKVSDIMLRNKTPIVVGNSSIWTQMLMEGIPIIPEPTREQHEKAEELLRDAEAAGDWAKGCAIFKSLNSTVINSASVNNWYRLKKHVATALQSIATNTPFDGKFARNKVLPHVDFRHYYICQNRLDLNRDSDFLCEKIVPELLRETTDLLLKGTLDLKSQLASSAGYKQTINFLLRNNFVPNDSAAFYEYLSEISMGMRQVCRHHDSRYKNNDSALFIRLGRRNFNTYRKNSSYNEGKRFVEDATNEVLHWAMVTPDGFKQKKQLQREEAKIFSKLFDHFNPRKISLKTFQLGDPVFIRYILCRLLVNGVIEPPIKDNGWYDAITNPATGFTPANVPNLDDPEWSADELDVRASADDVVLRSYGTIWRNPIALRELVPLSDELRYELEKSKPELVNKSVQ